MSIKIVAGKDFSRLSNKLTHLQWEDVKRKASIGGNLCSAKELLNYYTGIYDYTVPYWLKSDFSSDVWDLKLNESDISINWNEIILSDGFKLTEDKHLKLLNSFKYWILATDDPYENGGKVLEQSTVYNNVNKVIQLINAILLHGDVINLAEQHLEGLTDDFFMSILVNYASGGGSREGIYEFTSRVRELLDKKISLVSDEQASKFMDKYPTLSRSLLDEEKLLGFSINERVKACCWLNSVGFYGSNSDKPSKKFGHISILVNYIYSGKVLVRPKFTTIAFEELKLEKSTNRNECRGVPNKDRALDSISKGQLSKTVYALKLLNVINNKPDSCSFPIDSIKLVTIPRIMQHVRVKQEGRYLTVPPEIVFDVINKSYKFIFENQDGILASILSVSHQVVSKNKELLARFESPSSMTLKNTRRAWIDSYALGYVDKELLQRMDIQYVDAIKPSSPDRHLKIRQHESLVELYHVLMGCIQALVGSLVARRQGELIDLKSHGNLIPNIDPSLAGKSQNFHLCFRLKKSGVGGKNSQKAILKRPLPYSLALIIWKLEKFNQKVMKLNINNGKLSLFNNLNPTRYVLSKASHSLYNQHLDAMCDYFETPLVDYGKNDLRRYYLRQHQFRRFFAMIFYWSKGYTGAESLRWMLGHTDLEHLHNYITESEPGAVLRGIKASYITHELKERKKLENIDKLQELIAARYRVKHPSKVMFSTLSIAAQDFEDTEDYQTVPHISQLEEESRIESLVLELLEDHSITLEPTFFSVRDGKRKVNDFTLVLSVNERY